MAANYPISTTIHIVVSMSHSKLIHYYVLLQTKLVYFIKLHFIPSVIPSSISDTSVTSELVRCSSPLLLPSVPHCSPMFPTVPLLFSHSSILVHSSYLYFISPVDRLPLSQSCGTDLFSTNKNAHRTQDNQSLLNITAA